MENISDSTSDATDGKAEKNFDENGNRIISLNFAPVNTNQQNFINVDSKIDFNTKVGDNGNRSVPFNFGTICSASKVCSARRLSSAQYIKKS